MSQLFRRRCDAALWVRPQARAAGSGRQAIRSLALTAALSLGDSPAYGR